jgi:hypothetical protein
MNVQDWFPNKIVSLVLKLFDIHPLSFANGKKLKVGNELSDSE